MPHERTTHCLDDLSTVRTHPSVDPGVWRCIHCSQQFQMWEVVEALRERAVARDKVYRQISVLAHEEGNR